MISKKHITKNNSIPQLQKEQTESNKAEIDNTGRLRQESFGLSRLIGEAPAFNSILKRINEIAASTKSVLLLGEVGTEKELFARAIYYLSQRKDKPYIAIDCSTIPTGFIEDELFGQNQDKYNKTRRTKEGYISKAEGGTLFLNEIDSIPVNAQERLFQIFENKKYQTYKNNKSKNADVRIIAASNINLLDPKANGYFSKDLLLEFSEFIITIPPLKSRRSDIPLLVNHFIDKYSELYNLEKKIISEKALSKLMSYHWPGNIKELEYIIHQSLLECKGSVIESVDISFLSDFENQEIDEISFKENKIQLIEKFEREYLARLLLECEGNINRALNISQMSRRSFFRKMKKYKISFRGL